ncbi:unnamed protein product [Protopolystoma xenopodis]|uniref:Uncharacterized protein n=1 Tax=Protopolystoma xenopodis TaxID=117903 RepID=A0A3S5BCZ0_9PLAT|nr:unnamed protein product [Protopolystoma xenopodis]
MPSQKLRFYLLMRYMYQRRRAKLGPRPRKGADQLTWTDTFLPLARSLIKRPGVSSLPLSLTAKPREPLADQKSSIGSLDQVDQVCRRRTDLLTSVSN